MNNDVSIKKGKLQINKTQGNSSHNSGPGSGVESVLGNVEFKFIENIHQNYIRQQNPEFHRDYRQGNKSRSKSSGLKKSKSPIQKRSVNPKEKVQTKNSNLPSKSPSKAVNLQNLSRMQIQNKNLYQIVHNYFKRNKIFNFLKT